MNSSRNPNPSQDELLAELEELRFESHDLLFGSIRNQWIANWKPHLSSLTDSVDENTVALGLIENRLARLDRILGLLWTDVVFEVLDELWTANHATAIWELDSDRNTIHLAAVWLSASETLECVTRETVGNQSIEFDWSIYLIIQYGPGHSASFIAPGGAYVDPDERSATSEPDDEAEVRQMVDSMVTEDGPYLGTFPRLAQVISDFALAKLRSSKPDVVATSYSSISPSVSEHRYAPGESALIGLIERRLLELETLLTDAHHDEPPRDARHSVLWKEFFGHSTGGHHTIHLEMSNDGTSELSTGPMTWTLDVNKHYPEHASAGQRSELPWNVEITLFHDEEGTCAISTRPPYDLLTDARPWNRRLIALPTVSGAVRQGLVAPLAASTITTYAIDLPSSLRDELLNTGPGIGTPNSSGPSPDPIDFDDIPF